MTIRKGLYVIIGLISIGFISCNSDNGQQSEFSQSASQASAVSTQAVNVSNTNASLKGGTVVHPPTKLGNLMSLSGSASGNFSASGSGLNPAHGLPGHDCAVGVGEPLPGRNTSAPSLANVPTPETTGGLNSNIKINPAHGQPGHDCAIAVGAPLPGSESTVVPAQTASAPSALTNIAAPQKLGTPNFKLNPNTKINPAHGQPGHDCGVAVGAPLPSAASNAKATINPAHGEPGHDCSVAVGAPLPS